MKISKVKLMSLCIKYHTMNVYDRMNVQLCAVLTLALDGDQ